MFASGCKIKRGLCSGCLFAPSRGRCRFIMHPLAPSFPVAVYFCTLYQNLSTMPCSRFREEPAVFFSSRIGNLMMLDDRSFFWAGVSVMGSSSSANNWEIVISNALQIFSSDGMLGKAFFRYHDEMVVWGRPECSASWYSLQPRSNRYCVIAERISFTRCHSLLAFFANYTPTYRCILIINVV